VGNWNPWQGCQKVSEGCKNCYIHTHDGKEGKNVREVIKTKFFDLPVQRKKSGEYKLQSKDVIYTCFYSDFFIEDADDWRKEAWSHIKERSDLRFLFLTKRIHRFFDCIPYDWNEGYDNVVIGVSVENQAMADKRLSLLMQYPIKHKGIVCQPLIGPIDLHAYLKDVEFVTVGGEQGSYGRTCEYDWVMNIRHQCIQAKIPFSFRQTGTNFIKDGIHYKIARKDQSKQAKKADIDIRTEHFGEDL
jgi:protein gp37